MPSPSPLSTITLAQTRAAANDYYSGGEIRGLESGIINLFADVGNDLAGAVADIIVAKNMLALDLLPGLLHRLTELKKTINRINQE